MLNVIALKHSEDIYFYVCIINHHNLDKKHQAAPIQKSNISYIIHMLRVNQKLTLCATMVYLVISSSIACITMTTPLLKIEANERVPSLLNNYYNIMIIYLFFFMEICGDI